MVKICKNGELCLTMTWYEFTDWIAVADIAELRGCTITVE